MTLGEAKTHALSSARLNFRPLALTDLEDYVRLYADPDVTRWLEGERPRTAEESTARLARDVAHWTTRGFGRWAVREKLTGAFVGRAGFSRMASGDVELGYVLSPKFWGTGCASEAAARVLEYGFETWGFSRVIATVRPENSASKRVLEKLGMKLVGEGEYFGARHLVFEKVHRAPERP